MVVPLGPGGSPRVVLKRFDNPPGASGAAMPPGTWGIWDPCADGEFRTVVICCPSCGKHSSVTKHSITAEGVPDPSFVCPHPPCSWHVFVWFENWTFGEKAAGVVTLPRLEPPP